MLNNNLFIKISGKTISQEEYLRDLLKLFLNYVKIRDYCLFIISGGSSKVDFLRIQYKEDADKDSKQDSYHWKAIQLMDENLEYIFNILQEMKKENEEFIDVSTDIISNVPKINDLKSGIYLVKSFEILKNNDKLDHSWAITSDSIAIYLSSLFNLKNTILLKNTPYLEYKGKEFARIDSKYLQDVMDKEGYSKKIGEHLGKGTIFPVDPYTPELIKKLNMKVLLLDGTNMKKIEEFLKYYIIMEDFDLPNYGTLIVP
jgi:5-(aminomethyl)-3-furanmethanol phosphate kinase